MLPADVLERPELERKTRAIIDRLLAEKGITRYVPFDGSEEASEVLPGGIYPVSGLVLTDEGRLFHYWLGWHADKNDYTLGDEDGFWSEIDVSEYEADRDYQAARRKLGLSQRLVSRYVPPRPSVLSLRTLTYARLGQRNIPHLWWSLHRTNQVQARSPALRAARDFEVRISGLDDRADRYDLARQQLHAIAWRLVTEVFHTASIFSTEWPGSPSRVRSAIRALGVVEREIETDPGCSYLAGLGQVTAANFTACMQQLKGGTFSCLLCTQTPDPSAFSLSFLDQLLALERGEISRRGSEGCPYRIDYVRLVGHLVARDMAVVTVGGYGMTFFSLCVFVPGSLRETVAQWLEAHLPEFRADLAQRAAEHVAEIKAQEPLALRRRRVGELLVQSNPQEPLAPSAGDDVLVPAKVLDSPELERQTRSLIARLLAAKGLTRYVIFHEVTNTPFRTEVLPGGLDPVSGALLTDEGRIFCYQLGWHADKDDYTLGDEDGFWYEDDVSLFEDDPNRERRAYHAAKQELGLPRQLESRYVPPRSSILTLRTLTYGCLGQRNIPHLWWWLHRGNQNLARSRGLHAARAYELRISGLDHSEDRRDLAYQQMGAIARRLVTEVFRATYVFSTEWPESQDLVRSIRGIFWERPKIRALETVEREIETNPGYSYLAALGQITAENFAECMQLLADPSSRSSSCLLCTQTPEPDVFTLSFLDRLLALQRGEMSDKVVGHTYRVDFVRLVTHLVERDMAVVTTGGYGMTFFSLCVFVPGSLRETVAQWLEAHLPEFRADLARRVGELAVEIEAQETGRA